MNIFILSNCPKTAAQLQIDRHVIKMPSECSIMLANAYSLEELKNAPKTKDGKCRKHGYPYHGCTKWAISNLSNFNWLLEHGLALCNEYQYRFDKTHFCKDFLIWCKNNQPNLSKLNLSKPFLAMPEKYKSDNFVSSYISYYINEKKTDKNGKNMFLWTKRNVPNWAK